MASLPLPVFAMVALVVSSPLRAQTFTTLYDFQNGADGNSPNSTLVVTGGSVFGTTLAGGIAGNGTVFRVDTRTGAESVIHSFGGGIDGRAPEGAVFLRSGMLYGTTMNGGSAQTGVAFAVNVATGSERVLHNFSSPDGFIPEGGLTFKDGAAFGTTRYGGPSQLGTLYRIELAGGTFKLVADLGRVEEGSESSAAVVAHTGILFGTAEGGGASGFGLAFALNSKTRKETVLYSFQGGEDGLYPSSGLVYLDGMLYGVTSSGGDGGFGTIYRIDAATGTYKLLYSLNAADGGNAVAGLALNNGVLYGETTNGGAGGAGTVFAFTIATARERVLHSFSTSSGGSVPSGGLTVEDGTLYGTTSAGGAFNEGTVFKLTP